MLYDPKWKVKTDSPLTGLIAWLETKNPEERYDWSNCDGACLMGQYGASLGLSWEQTCNSGGVYQQMQELGFSCLETPWTFGAALDRARKLLASAEEA